MLCDVDTVNPYFRTKDSEQILNEAGIRLVSTIYANTNLDNPSLAPEIRAAFDYPDMYSIFDVGGDDSGAIALGQFSNDICALGYEMFLIVNRHRLLTHEPESLVEYVKDIEAASHLKFTSIINNPNIGIETESDVLSRSMDYIGEVSRLTGLPVKYNTIREDLVADMPAPIQNLFPIRVYNKPNWYIQEVSYGESCF
jgi:hypothetical protein